MFVRDPTKLWRRYVVALGAVLVLLVSSHVASVSALRGGEEAASVINISGRQRMLSQRILYFAGRAADGATSTPDADPRLDASIDLFEASHAALSRGGSLGLSVEGAASRASSYFDRTGGTTLDELVRSYVADSRVVAAGGAGAAAAWQRMQDVGPGELLERLNGAVLAFEAEARAQTRRIDRISHATFLLALLVLALEALVIFWPAHRAVRTTIDRLTAANDALDAARTRAEDLFRQADRAREAAENAQRRLTGFVHHMSHELRTPLNGVMGMLSLMDDARRRGAPAESLDEMIAEAQLASGHLLMITNNVLDLSKLQAGRMTVAAAPYAPRQAVLSVLAIFRAQARAKGLTLRHDVDGSVPGRVVGDRVRIGQVLANLVGNAVKFADAGTIMVSLRAARDGDRDVLRVEVSDEGAAIPPEDRDRLFEPFEQGDGPSIRAGSGTGLGLPICRELVTLMGGTIGMECGPVRGNRFRFAIPFAAPKSEAHAPDANPREVRPAVPGPGLRVLVVDDSGTNRLVAMRLLERRGHRATCAANGAEALDALSAAEFDLVLMDVQMPVMDGITATRRLRRMGGEVAALPVVALTAFEHRAEFLAAGFDGYLAKPLTPEALDRAIGEVTGAARLAAAG